MEPLDKLGLTDAARMLEALAICKAFGPRGNVNGPNCQRFGHRDPNTGRWGWSAIELADEARRRGSASEELIEAVLKQFSQSNREAYPPTAGPRNRAEIEKEFREAVCELEFLLRAAVNGERLDTLGKLIGKAEKLRAFPRHLLAELSSINEVRKSLYHPSGDVVDDASLQRAIASIKAQIAVLRGNA